MSGRKVTIWCSDVSGIGGQSQVTRHVANLLDADDTVLICYKRYFNFFDLFTYIISVIRFIRCSLGVSSVVYFVNSRSIVGFIRDFPIYLIVHLTNTKCIVHSHGSDLISLTREYSILSMVAVFLLRKHVVLVPSQHVSDELLFVLPKIEVLENFTEVHEDQLAKAKLFNSIQNNEGAIKIAWNSNIIYSKGFFSAVSYIENLYTQGIDIEFHVFGIPMACDYKDLAACEKKFQSFLNVPWFIYRGQVSRSEVIEALADCSVVALPSFYASECQPLALIDAMALGKYLLVSDTPAIRATCSRYPGTYTLVKEDGSDSDRFIKNARKFLLNSEKSAQHAQDRFSKQRFSERIIGYLYV